MLKKEDQRQRRDSRNRKGGTAAIVGPEEKPG